jgi:hypothetical protein
MSARTNLPIYIKVHEKPEIFDDESAMTSYLYTRVTRLCTLCTNVEL